MLLTNSFVAVSVSVVLTGLCVGSLLGDYSGVSSSFCRCDSYLQKSEFHGRQ